MLGVIPQILTLVSGGLIDQVATIFRPWQATNPKMIAPDTLTLSPAEVPRWNPKCRKTDKHMKISRSLNGFPWWLKQNYMHVICVFSDDTHERVFLWNAASLSALDSNCI